MIASESIELQLGIDIFANLLKFQTRALTARIEILSGKNGDSMEKIIEEIWSDLDNENSFPAIRPLLAHYTSIQNTINILRGKEIWLSNPLLMNDHEELRFGLLESYRELSTSQALKAACDKNGCYESFMLCINTLMAQMDSNDAFDIYIFCLSKHTENEFDGKLSMWRGYGSDGNGAAILFDMNQIVPTDGSPIWVSPIVYGTRENRLSWIREKVEKISKLIARDEFDEGRILDFSWHVFARFLSFALYTKHKGFEEEAEWRLVYIKRMDQENLAKDMLSYVVGDKGVAPKLKLKLAGKTGLISNTFDLDKVVSKIILGPTAASPLSERAFKRMLESEDLNNFCEKVVSSTIPYRGR